MYAYKSIPWVSQNNVVDELSNVMVSAGWTLHDSILSPYGKVLYSQGENNNRAPGYIHVKVQGSYVQMIAYLYWDNSTHVGTCSGYSYGYADTSGVNRSFWAYATKDLVTLARTTIVDSTVIFFGLVPKLFNELVTNTTDAIVAGSNVVVPVTSAAGFKHAMTVQIIGTNATEGRDKLLIDSVDLVGNTITISVLPRNFASGAYIGTCPCPIFSRDVFNGYYPAAHLRDAGVVAATTASAWTISPYYNVAYMDPDERTGMYILSPILFLESNTTGPGGDTNSLIGFSDQYFFYPSGGSLMDLFGTPLPDGKYETGTAESGTNNTLTDTNKSWTINEWAGYYVIIGNGTGVNQSRKIVSNTATTLTLNANWTTNPSSDSVYYIVTAVYRNLGTIAPLEDVV